MPESQKRALEHVREVSKKGQLPLVATQPQVRAEMDPQTETLQNHSTPHNWATPLPLTSDKPLQEDTQEFFFLGKTTRSVKIQR